VFHLTPNVKQSQIAIVLNTVVLADQARRVCLLLPGPKGVRCGRGHEGLVSLAVAFIWSVIMKSMLGFDIAKHYSTCMDASSFVVYTMEHGEHDKECKEMIIDFHTHLGDHRVPDRMDRLPVTWEGLIERLDDEGIDRAVALPSGGSPESLKAPFLFSEQVDIVTQLRAGARYPERIILFGNLDPRMSCLGNLEPHQVENPPETDFSWILERFKELGCVGIGEVTANIALDDPRVINLFRQCGKWNMPVVFHCTGAGRGVYGLYDEAGAPRLERLLQQVPDTIIVGHAPGFWAEIEGGIGPENKFIYPRGSIKEEGRLCRLL